MRQMRKRSESFYAKNEEEFKEHFNNKNVSLSERRKYKKAQLSAFDLAKENYELNRRINFNFYDDLDMDELGVNKTFQTNEEEENELASSLDNINIAYKKRDKQMILDNISQISKGILTTIPSNLNQKTTSSSIKQYKERSNTFDSLNSLQFDFDDPYSISLLSNSFLLSNIDITDETLYFLFIGDEKAGKTYFIKKLLYSHDDNNDSKKDYSHTKSLEIYTKQIKLLGNYIRLELWDTNLSIVNSELFKCYQKLSDGIILIIDPTMPSSSYFIYDQLKEMTKENFYQHKNIFIICNCFKEEINNECKDVLIKIKTEFGFSVYYVSFEEINQFQNVVNRLISMVYLKKGKGLNKKKEKKKMLTKQPSTPAILKDEKYSSNI